jgi:hypothetical protein
VIFYAYACNKRDGITDTTREDIMDRKDTRDILRDVFVMPSTHSSGMKHMYEPGDSSAHLSANKG